MKTLTKIVAGVSIVAGLVGGAYLNGQGNLSERKNLVYQGYHVDSTDGSNLLVFDDKPLTDRTTDPELRIIGDPNRLEIGTKYDVKVKSPRWIGQDRVYSIHPSD
ncbi:MAG: hypothetical protein ABIH79_01445 [archaeon]